MFFNFPDHFLAIDNAFDREVKYIAFFNFKFFQTIAAFLSFNIDNPILGDVVSYSI